ncbi:MAG: hypothetical protein HY425_01890 [Candidatus Levybacteria bacterium]|nr:hypothetical protein [Candidatus Levybacteria bacterium]
MGKERSVREGLLTADTEGVQSFQKTPKPKSRRRFSHPTPKQKREGEKRLQRGPLGPKMKNVVRLGPSKGLNLGKT